MLNGQIAKQRKDKKTLICNLFNYNGAIFYDFQGVGGMGVGVGGPPNPVMGPQPVQQPGLYYLN